MIEGRICVKLYDEIGYVAAGARVAGRRAAGGGAHVGWPIDLGGEV